MKTYLRGYGAMLLAVASLLAVHPFALSAAQSSATVTLSSVTPSTAEPGLTTVRLLGSGFPEGTINAGNIQVSITPASGPATIVSASQYQSVTGTTSRVSFVLPSSISVTAPATYSISISDSTDGFSSANSLPLTVTPLASLSSINPSAASPGQSVNVSITGLYSHFLTGLTQVSAGSGITVSAVAVTSPTTLTAQLAIAAAATGSQTITVSTGGEVESIPFNITITKATVPNVVGDTKGAANAAITAATLTVGTITYSSDPTVPQGNVISQYPIAGTSVGQGSAVNLVISTGPAVSNVFVPDVVGNTESAAYNALNAVHLTVGTVTTQSSSTVPNSDVISQSPVAGTSVTLGSPVNLVVSTGPAPVTVPNVVGDTQSAATSAITGAKLMVGTITIQNSATVPKGDVISQSPTAGTAVAPASAVNLVISSGTGQDTVPNVVGDTQSAATTAITSAALTVGAVTTQSSSTVPKGDVISQSPIAGTSVTLGSAVNLVISTGPAPVTVPNVVGNTQSAATTAITSAGLIVGTITTQYSATVPKGDVISQTPVGGTSVNPGSPVSLVISTGPAPVTVPNVVGDTQSAATTAITSATLIVGTVTSQSSATVPKGDVISQSPVGGTSAAPGSPVNLVISSGPGEDTVPNVVGDTQAAATSAITGAGLTVGAVTTQSSTTVPKGDVISQSPMGGTLVAPASAVNLVISTGPAPVIVPNVVGDTQSAATTAITSAGLTVGTVTIQSSATVPKGDVISQSPVGGTSVAPASAVNLVISTGSNPVLVPNVVGDTQSAATTAITSAGLTVGTVTTQTSTTVPAGTVISQSPAAGTTVVSGATVNFVVSSGAPPVTVPNVVGDTQSAAATAITSASLTVGTVTTQSSTTVPKGDVINQSPTAGTSVAPGSAVNLAVSSGPAVVYVTVPYLIGATQQVATTDLTADGLVVGTITTQSSATVPAGDVISQSPAGGTSVPTGSAVNIVVSTGPTKVTVPNVVGDTQSAATTAINTASLTVGTITTQTSTTVPAGDVISQNPTAGTSVNAGSPVNLVISTGPPQVAVPNVVGDTQSTATTAITTAGLIVGTITTQSSTTVPAGDVISQSPVAGTLVNSGSAVNLVISTGPPQVLVPNVVGDTKSTATTAIASAGLTVGTITTQSSTTVLAGDIISQSPAAGTSVASGSAVNLVISAGSGLITVPNVVGDTEAAATTAIATAGLAQGAIAYQTSSTVPIGDVISQSPAAGSQVSARTAVSIFISATILAGGNEAVSNLISIQNGIIGSQSLPIGKNEAVSNLFSIQNGTIGITSLPPGRNEAVSNLFSIQNGVIGATTLPKGENEAVSNLLSVQNGVIGSLQLPTGKNEAVSDLISAKNGASPAAIVKLKSSLTLASTNTNGVTAGSENAGASLDGLMLTAGETITVASSVPAQISLNGQAVGNDAGSATDLTFVVPESASSLRIRAGSGPDSSVSLQPQTSVFTGQVLDAKDAPEANAEVRIRHAGLEAEIFKLPAGTPAGEAPSLTGLTPVKQEPVSSLNLHNPAQTLGYFPIGAIVAPNFAVRLSGQFQAQSSGQYIFFVAANEGAQFTIDGKPIADARNVKPGLEAPVTVELAEGWHDIELLAYSISGSAELVVSFTPPDGAKQTIQPKLLRAQSTALTAVTDANGKFSITAPAWLDQVEAVTSAAGSRTGASAPAASGVTSLGQIHLSPGANF